MARAGNIADPMVVAMKAEEVIIKHLKA